ncbi:MAG: hypothetical protein QOF48_360 [Verrucomicrobiota bacterium]
MRILAASLFVMAALVCKAQIYSAHVYAGGVTYEHDWLVGSGSHQFGLSQISQWEDSRGLVIIDVGHERERGGTQRRYTRMHFGAAMFSVRAPAWLVAIALGAAITSLFLLIIVGVGRIRRRQSHAPNPA